MFSIGEQLYRLTQRDEEGLLVDSYVRSISQTLGIGVGSINFNFAVEEDRAFFLHSLALQMQAEAATLWFSWSLRFLDRDGNSLALIYIENTATGLVTDGGSSTDVGLARPCMKNRKFALLCPPGLSFLQIQVNRTGTTGAVPVSATLTGYQLPPGRIGRVS